MGGRRRSQRRVAMHAEGLPSTTSAQTRLTVERALLDLRYLATGLGTAVLALALWIAAVTLSLSLAVFVIGLPVMLLSATAFRALADLDRRNAALVLGAPLRGRYRDHGGDAFLARLAATLKDPQTWKDLQWLVVHSVVGLAFGCAAISLVAQLAGLATLPLWFWAPPGGLDWWGLSGVWQVDTLWESLLVAPLAIPLGAITVVLLRVMARGEAGLAAALLGEPREPVVAAGATRGGLGAAARLRPRAAAARRPGGAGRVRLLADLGPHDARVLLARLGLARPGDLGRGARARPQRPARRGRPGAQLPGLRRPVRRHRRDLRRGVGARRRRLLVAGVADPRHVAGAGGARAVRVPRPAAVGARAGARRARRPAHAHAPRGAGRAGLGAAPDRARPPRRGAGAAGGPEHAARPRRGAAVRPARARRPRPPGARRGERGDRRAARSGARDRAAGARRPRARRRRRRARPARGDQCHRRRPRRSPRRPR